MQYSEDNTTATGEGWEHRVALGSVGFSRGVHYWEFTIDKYDADTDPAFGIARIDVTRDKMLGTLLNNNNLIIFISLTFFYQEKTIKVGQCTLTDRDRGFNTQALTSKEWKGEST